jgi:ElaB/YqjD/DUF883 family membrane-anchored ribosome-binding protein
MSEPVTYTSFASLEKDVLQLKECMDIIQETVQLQQSSLNSIEYAIQHTKDDAKQAYQQIIAADTYSSGYTMAAVGSAMIGLVTLLLLL